jgi:acyl carrier protein
MDQNRQNIYKQIIEILGRLNMIRSPEKLDENTGLLGRGIGLDSVEILQIVTAIEEEFDLSIDDDELEPSHFRSIDNLINFIERRL